MSKHYRMEFFGQFIFMLVGLLILSKILISIYNPVSIAADLKHTQGNFYQQILNKSTASMDTVMNSYEDEDRKDLFSIVFKYLTNIDLSNPRTYITSQIPVLDLIDVTSLVANEEGPVVVTPTNTGDTTTKPDTDTPSTEPPKNDPPGSQVTPVDKPEPPKKTLDPSKPQVLIYHTHTTERYGANANGKYFDTDLNTTVAEVGEELKKELESKYGISVIHDMTIHDTVRDSAYSKAAPTLSSYVKRYPNLKLIIDLHRDGTPSKTSVTAVMNNENYARTMFVIGNKNKSYKTNEALARKMNDIFNALYPGFSKGIIYKEGKYNQQYSGKSVLIEVGSNQNSLDEAIKSSKLIARVVAETLK